MNSDEDYPAFSPLLEMTDLSEKVHDEKELEEEKLVPPLSSYIQRIKFWLGQLRYPILVLLANVAGIVMVYGITQTAVFRWNRAIIYADNPADDEKIVKNARIAFASGSIVFLLMFLLDAYSCARGFHFFEQLLSQQQDETAEGNTGTGTAADTKVSGDAESSDNNHDRPQDKPIDFIAMSRAVDALFGCIRMPNSTFLIGLLYSLFTLAVLGVSVSTTSLLFISTTSNMRSTMSCYFYGPWTSRYVYEEYNTQEVRGVASLKNEASFTSLPASVQNWIEGHEDTRFGERLSNNKSLSYEQDAPTLPYVKVVDRSIAFSYSRKLNTTYSEVGFAVSPLDGTAILEYPSNTSRLFEELSLDLLGIPASAPYHGWCGVTAARDPSLAFHEVLCYHEGNMTRRFAMVLDENQSNGGMLSVPSYYVTEDTLWVAYEQSTDIESEGDSYQEKKHASIVSYNISTMERKVEVEKIRVYKRNQVSSSRAVVRQSCRTWHAIAVWPSIMVLILLCIYIVRKSDPSCTVPGSIALSLLANNVLLGPYWPSVLVLLLTCVCTGLMITHKTQRLQKRSLSLEMLVWAGYTFLACIFCGLYPGLLTVRWDNLAYQFRRGLPAGFTIALLAMVPALMNAIVLNHPVFEMFGIIFGVFSIASLPLAFARGPMFLLLPLVLLVVSLGCCVMGRFCRYYHLHATVYCRRGWRQLAKKC